MTKELGPRVFGTYCPQIRVLDTRAIALYIKRLEGPAVAMSCHVWPANEHDLSLKFIVKFCNLLH